MGFDFASADVGVFGFDAEELDILAGLSQCAAVHRRVAFRGGEAGLERLDLRSVRRGRGRLGGGGSQLLQGSLGGLGVATRLEDILFQLAILREGCIEAGLYRGGGRGLVRRGVELALGSG